MLCAIWWLERQIVIEFAEKVKEARIKNDQNKIRELDHERWWNFTDVRHSRQARIQQKWIRKAENLMIFIPSQKFPEDEEENEYW